MATVRDSVVDAVETRLAAIQVSGGYRTDLGGRLRTWQTTPPDWSDLPVLLVSDPTDEMGKPAYNLVRHTLTTTVEALLPGGTALATLREYAADILEAVGADPTWSGLAIGTRATTVEIDPGEINRVNAGVAVTLEIEFETALWAT